MVLPGRNGTTRFGVFELDTRSGELRKAGARIRLQIQPLKVLVALLDEPGAVVTREELKRRIWPNDSFGDFDHAVNVAVAKLRAALADSADTPRFIETLPRRGYRFIFPVTSPTEAAVSPVVSAPVMSPPATAKSTRLPRRVFVALSIAFVAATAFVWWYSSRKAHALTDKDTIVLADFTNSTGDTVFDGTLRQGLSVQLGQSPFLRLISEERIQQTLRLMGQPPDARLTPEIARQLCERTQSAGVLEGSIANLGSQYVLGLKAVNCHSGDVLAEEQVTADAKEHVLKALAEACTALRWKLGESLGMVKKFNAPVEQVTTPSLDALQAYSLGRTMMVDKEDYIAAVPLFQRAIALDPNFAMAYAALGMTYESRSEKQSLGYLRMAYDLRDRVSEREKFYIETHYYEGVTGDWEKARQVYELWTQTYPRDDVAHFNLSNLSLQLGQFEKARTEAMEDLRLLPMDCMGYADLAASLINLNRMEEARAAAQEALDKKLDCVHLRFYLYELAFLRKDNAGMAEQVKMSDGKWVVGLLQVQGLTAAYYGQVRHARELFRRAVSTAEQSGQQELVALLEVQEAEMEALLGNAAAARQHVAAGLALSGGREVQSMAALALALAGETHRAQMLADDLGRRLPQNTLVQFSFLPAVRAQMALNRKDPGSAIEVLRAATAYELGDMDHDNGGYTLYLRGQAYLSAHQGSEAAAEFQKIIDHPGIVYSSPIASLAHLGLARAYAAEGDPVKAKAAYAELFTIWKDADADVPVYQQARAEYAKLQ